MLDRIIYSVRYVPGVTPLYQWAHKEGLQVLSRALVRRFPGIAVYWHGSSVRSRVVPGISDYDLKIVLPTTKRDELKLVREIDAFLKHYRRLWPIPVDFDVLPGVGRHRDFLLLTAAATHLQHYRYPQLSETPSFQSTNPEIAWIASLFYLFDLIRKAQELSRYRLRDDGLSWRWSVLYERRVLRMRGFWGYVKRCLVEGAPPPVTYDQVVEKETIVSPLKLFEETMQDIERVTRDMKHPLLWNQSTPQQLHTNFDRWRPTVFLPAAPSCFHDELNALNRRGLSPETYIVTPGLFRLFWGLSLPYLEQKLGDRRIGNDDYHIWLISIMWNEALMRYYRYFRKLNRLAPFPEFLSWWRGLTALLVHQSRAPESSLRVLDTLIARAPSRVEKDVVDSVQVVLEECDPYPAFTAEGSELS